MVPSQRFSKKVAARLPPKVCLADAPILGPMIDATSVSVARHDAYCGRWREKLVKRPPATETAT